MQQTPFTPLGQTTPAFPGTYPQDPSAVLPGFHRPLLLHSGQQYNNIKKKKKKFRKSGCIFTRKALHFKMRNQKRTSKFLQHVYLFLNISNLLLRLWETTFVGMWNLSVILMLFFGVGELRELTERNCSDTEITGIHLIWTPAARTWFPGGTTLNNSFSLHPEKHFLSLPSTLSVFLSQHD